MAKAEIEVTRVEPLVVRRATAAAMLDCSESTIHKLIKEQQLATVFCGADLRITVSSIKRLARATASKRQRKDAVAEAA